MAQTASAKAEIFEPETSGHQHPRTGISRNIGRGTEISQMTSAAVTTPPHHSTARTSRSAAAPVKGVFTTTILSTFSIDPRSSVLTFISNVCMVLQVILLTFPNDLGCSVLTFMYAGGTVVQIVIFSLAMFIFILSRGFMLILSRGIILIRGVSSSPAEISSAPEAESSAPANAATANADATVLSVPATAALVNAATASSAPANADESNQSAFAAAIAAADAVLDLVPFIISALGTFMSIVVASLMLDKDVSHSIRDLGLAVFYLQLLAMICLSVGMGIKQQLRQLLFFAGIVMASVSVLLMVVFISLIFIVASKKK